MVVKEDIKILKKKWHLLYYNPTKIREALMELSSREGEGGGTVIWSIDEYLK